MKNKLGKSTFTWMNKVEFKLKRTVWKKLNSLFRVFVKSVLGKLVSYALYLNIIES